MSIVFTIFIISLLLGQFEAIHFDMGITVYLHDIMGVVLLALGIIEIGKRKHFQKPVLFYPMFALLLAGIISLIAQYGRFSLVQIVGGSLYLVRLLTYIGIYIILVQKVVLFKYLEKHLIFLSFGFVILGYLQLIFLPYLQPYIKFGWDPHYYRLFSTFFDPNFAGSFIVLGICFQWGWYQRTMNKTLGFFILFMSVGALVLTFSRSSYLALIASSGIWIVLHRKWKIGLIGILIFLIIIVCIPKPGGDTLRLDRFPTALARIGNWQQSLVLFRMKPVFGNGFDTLRFAYAEDSRSHAAGGVDNSFLFVLVTMGITGFFSFLWVLKGFCSNLRWSSESKISSSLHETVVMCVVALSVSSQFNNTWFYPWCLILILIIQSLSELSIDDM